MKLFYFQQREENSLKNRTRFQPLFHRHGSLAIRSRKKIFQGFRSLSPFVYPGQTGQISALPDQRKKRNLRKRIEIEEREETTCLESRQPRITTLLLCQDLSPPCIIRSPKSTGPPVMSCPLPLFPFFFFFFFFSSFYPSTLSTIFLASKPSFLSPSF